MRAEPAVSGPKEPMLTLYQFEISPFCDKARRALNWKKQPYEVHEVSLWQARTQLRRLNPAGKLPCLEHDGRLVADSSEIALYLEERFPTPPLLPSDPGQRALCHVLEDWADESLYFYELQLRFGTPENARRWLPLLTAHDAPPFRALARLLLPRILAAQLRNQGIGRKPIAAVLVDLERQVRAIAALLAGRDFLLGGALTLADISVFAQLFCIRGSAEGAVAIEKEPAVVRWMTRVDEATAR
jgi:glutathione S-transferase